MADEMDEIWALYADDGAQALDTMEEALETFAEQPEDTGPSVGALFRAVHTFKGNARVLGLAQVEGMAHLAEDLIGLVRDEGVPLSDEITGTLVRAGDMLRGMLEETAETRGDVDPGPSAALKSDLRGLIARLTGQDDGDSAEVAESEGQVTPAEDIVPDESPAEEPDDAAHVPQAAKGDGVKAPASPPAAPGLDPALAGLFDQLADSDGPGFDDFEEDEEEEGTEAAQDPEGQDGPPERADDEETSMTDAGPPPQAAPGPRGAGTLAEVTQGKLATIDPAYCAIFAEMVQSCCAALEDLTADWSGTQSAESARAEVERLHYAATQMSLADFLAPLDEYLDRADLDPGVTSDLRDALAGLLEAGLLDRDEAEEAADGAVETAPTAPPLGVRDEDTKGAQAFFAAMAALYPEIADQGMRAVTGTPPRPEERRALADRIKALAAPQGYVRVADAADLLAGIEGGPGYRAAELTLYEELVAVERAQPAAIFDDTVLAPGKLLGAWCSDHIFDTLTALRAGLERPRKAGLSQAPTEGSPQDWFGDFETLMRRVYFACLDKGIGTASDLTMSLIDLFARTRMDGRIPDAILIQMARGLVDTLELVFDALDAGGLPDTSALDQMFDEARNLCFAASGVVTAKSIGTRLGLPLEFQRVLSPESVRAAHESIGAGLSFFVLRADLNEDDALAQGFLECITSGRVRMITNVTVFEGRRTLFDFLVASALSGDRLTEELALLDPSGTRLSLLHTLEVRPEPDSAGAEGPGAASSADADPTHSAGAELADGVGADSAALLEAVGAISASHALLEHDLSQLAGVDLMHQVTAALREAGLTDLNPEQSRLLRDRLEGHKQKLTEISEAGTQLAAELSHLQQQSVAQRSRPAEALLRPLKAQVAAWSGKAEGLGAQLSYTGGEVVLDRVLIEELRHVLKSLLALRLKAEQPPRRFHLSIEAESDRVRVDLSDNSPSPCSGADLAPIAEALRRGKGDLRAVMLPASEGLRFHLSLPRRMIVLDGMVVRLGSVRYVVPVDAIQRILQSDQVIPISAQAGPGSTGPGGNAQGPVRMLKLEEGGLVPIRPLEPGGAQNGAAKGLFVIVRSAGQPFALPVDELLGQQLVLLRPLEGVLASVRDMSGIAILSGGEVGMVVSVSALAPDTAAAA